MSNEFLERIQNTNYKYLDEQTKEFFENIYKTYKFSFQELKQLIDFAIDFKMWDEKPISELLKDEYPSKKHCFNHIRDTWNELKKRPNNYEGFELHKYTKDRKISFNSYEKEGLSLGSCPVASESTRCCNLLTLDAVESCGFDCSYCSIQSFYNEEKIGYDKNFGEKLKSLKLDPNQTYHIGTGQSSDSLMWGNKFGHLEALLEFAKQNPNVILEFKTKSNNIKYLVEHEVPKNVIVTWSLNTPTIIKNEEHLTANLDERIECARTLANKGVIVGFHFHPIVHYENYLRDYEKVYERVINTFSPNEVALISFGTLTFIKPVINKLRSREFKSKILEFEFYDANKKASYSLEIKREMFSHAFNSFKSWHGKVYLYLCMEDKSLWKECFGYEYSSNNQMEEFMKMSYMEKIKKF